MLQFSLILRQTVPHKLHAYLIILWNFWLDTFYGGLVTWVMDLKVLSMIN